MMIEIILWLIESLEGSVGTGAVYEDGSPMIEPCTSGVDAAYLMLRYAVHFLTAMRDNADAIIPLWKMLTSFCS